MAAPLSIPSGIAARTAAWTSQLICIMAGAEPGPSAASGGPGSGLAKSRPACSREAIAFASVAAEPPTAAVAYSRAALAVRTALGIALPSSSAVSTRSD